MTRFTSSFWGRLARAGAASNHLLLLRLVLVASSQLFTLDGTAVSRLAAGLAVYASSRSAAVPASRCRRGVVGFALASVPESRYRNDLGFAHSSKLDPVVQRTVPRTSPWVLGFGIAACGSFRRDDESSSGHACGSAGRAQVSEAHPSRTEISRTRSPLKGRSRCSKTRGAAYVPTVRTAISCSYRDRDRVVTCTDVYRRVGARST